MRVRFGLAQLRRELELDGTHLHPSYLSLLMDAVAAASPEMARYHASRGTSVTSSESAKQ